MLTIRGCPPRGLCWAGGISGATRVHGSSVRSEGYFFRNWSFFHIRAHSSAEGICANSLTNTSFCQALFPDSLLLYSADPRDVWHTWRTHGRMWRASMRLVAHVQGGVVHGGEFCSVAVP